VQNAEPLFDLIHPRAMRGGEVEPKARMSLSPFLNFFATVDADVVAHPMD
jgi:hypothetical protein